MMNMFSKKNKMRENDDLLDEIEEAYAKIKEKKNKSIFTKVINDKESLGLIDEDKSLNETVLLNKNDVSKDLSERTVDNLLKKEDGLNKRISDPDWKKAQDEVKKRLKPSQNQFDTV